MDIKLPPCLDKILNTKNYLERYYYLITRYVQTYKPEHVVAVLQHIGSLIGKVDFNLKLFDEFKCSDVPKELCEESCEIKKRLDLSIINRTKKVLLVRTSDDNDYLVIRMDDKELEIPLDHEKCLEAFKTEMMRKFKEYIDLDRRRKKDREIWINIMKYWLQVAEEVNEVDFLVSKNIDSDSLRILEVVLEYLTSPSIVLTKDIEKALENSSYAFYDEKEGFAYIYREHIIRYINSTLRLRVTPTKLSRLLKQKGIEPVRKKVRGVRYYFYRFKPTQEQLNNLEQEISTKAESGSAEAKTESSEDYNFDLDDLLSE